MSDPQPVIHVFAGYDAHPIALWIGAPFRQALVHQSRKEQETRLSREGCGRDAAGRRVSFWVTASCSETAGVSVSPNAGATDLILRLSMSKTKFRMPLSFITFRKK